MEGELQCATINYSLPKLPRSGVTFHIILSDQYCNHERGFKLESSEANTVDDLTLSATATSFDIMLIIKKMAAETAFSKNY